MSKYDAQIISYGYLAQKKNKPNLIAYKVSGTVNYCI